MDTPKPNPFQPYDTVKATRLSLKFAEDNGYTPPPTGPSTVLAISGDQVLLADGTTWHHSHFEKAGESPLKAEFLEAQAEAEASEHNVEDGEFDEFTTLSEVAAYIDKTYGEHYAKDGVQAFALIAKRPQRGLHFALGNVIKYADRFGEKDGMNRKDLLKVAHYTILALYCASKLETSQ